ncbi:hypothetical protein Syun_001588 [Stephania yunnanensis]|uniref:Uncharacterized protein n=1 Tax=Stephania yunnanensis TaxID=152371 RepID=A0AAP0Q791_9MAGN
MLHKRYIVFMFKKILKWSVSCFQSAATEHHLGKKCNHLVLELRLVSSNRFIFFLQLPYELVCTLKLTCVLLQLLFHSCNSFNTLIKYTLQ